MFEINNLFHPIRNAVTRQVTAENVFGKPHASAMTCFGSEQGLADSRRLGQPDSLMAAARDLGTGFKVRPCSLIQPGMVIPILDYDGPAVIRHFWIGTRAQFLRNLILRVYWDGASEPAIETPIGDFFCNAGPAFYGEVHALLINVNPTNALHSYIPMPFRKHARVTVESRMDIEVPVFYSFTITEEPVAEDEYYLHAFFNRENPTRAKVDYTILPKIQGTGRYLGTYMTWHQHAPGWWGEGEVRMFLDGDTDFATLCGTGTEDYFGGAWNFQKPFTAPFLGCPHLEPEEPGSRHAMYRFHVPDPILFQHELRVTCQCIGWQDDDRYLPLQDDISSVAYWYQHGPTHSPLPPLGNAKELAID